MPDQTSPTTSPETSPLTRNTVLALAAIVTAAEQGTKVGRMMPDGHAMAGQVVYGTARHIVTDSRALLAGERDDIRACLLRVTTTYGGEAFWPLSELVGEYIDGLFGTDVTIPTTHT